nr:erythromycin esterase family protein [Gemmatimonadota bacterium]
MPRSRVLMVAGAVLVLVPACGSGKFAGAQSPPQAAASSEDAFLRWSRTHAVSIASVEATDSLNDLRFLQPMAGEARVFALGESGHGIHEFLAFRNRLATFLIQNLGFTAVAAETGVFEGMLVDDYINGGSLDVATAAQAAFQWDGSDRALDENRALLEWLRRTNAATTGRRIHFYGIDLSGGDGRRGEILRARRSVDAAVSYLQRCDGDAGAALRQRLEPFLGRFTSPEYAHLSIVERNAGTATLADLTSLLKRRRQDCLAVTSEAEYDRALSNAVVARQVDAMFRATPDPALKQLDLRDMAMARDAAMAANLRSVLDHEGPNGRILLYAHNAHVMKVPMRRVAHPEAFRKSPTPMGQYLHSTLGNQLVVLGFAFQQGVGGDLPLPPSLPGSVDSELARVGPPLFAIDLRGGIHDPGASAWLRQPRMKRQLNDPDDDRYAELVPGDAFDALVFVHTVSLARPITTPGTLR